MKPVNPVFTKNAKINSHKRERKAEHFLYFEVYAFLHKSNVSKYQVIIAGKIQVAMHDTRL